MNTPVVINMEDELEAAFLKMQQLDPGIMRLSRAKPKPERDDRN